MCNTFHDLNDIQIMKKTILYVFNISLYCEKARWALDHFGIDCELRHVMVGTHRRIAKKLGAKHG